MHQIPPVTPRFFLMRGSLRSEPFPGLVALARHVGFSLIRELEHLESMGLPPFPGFCRMLPGLSPVVFSVRDEEDTSVSWRAVRAACRELEPARYSSRLRFWNGDGPVPGTGRIRAPRWRRRPGTTAELRLAAGARCEDGEPAWRAKRRNLPTVRDDLILRVDHSWKRQRRTRWKQPR